MFAIWFRAKRRPCARRGYVQLANRPCPCELRISRAAHTCTNHEPETQWPPFLSYSRYLSAFPSSLATSSTSEVTRAAPAATLSVAEIVKDCPTLNEEAVHVVIAFAAACAKDDLPVPPAPAETRKRACARGLHATSCRSEVSARNARRSHDGATG